MLEVKVSANHWYFHICRYVPYHIHIKYLWPDFHIWSWRGWWRRSGSRLPTQRSQFKSVFVRIGIRPAALQHMQTRRPLLIFEETLGQFPAVFVAPENVIFFMGSRDISSRVCGDQNRYLKPNLVIFVLKPYQNVSTVMSQHKIEVSTCLWFTGKHIANIYSGRLLSFHWTQKAEMMINSNRGYVCSSLFSLRGSLNYQNIWNNSKYTAFCSTSHPFTHVFSTSLKPHPWPFTSLLSPSC